MLHPQTQTLTPPQFYHFPLIIPLLGPQDNEHTPAQGVDPSLNVPNTVLDSNDNAKSGALWTEEDRDMVSSHPLGCQLPFGLWPQLQILEGPAG